MYRSVVVCILCAVFAVPAQQNHGEFHRRHRLEVDLKGEWRLEIGDDADFAKRKYADRDWEVVHVPNVWENEGFPGYDGFAWYRKTFMLPANLSQRKLYLVLGRIDDVDVAYMNGHQVGATGELPPNYRTEWETRRIYEIPSEYLRYGRENTVAVRVYDAHSGGGIYAGCVGIFSRLDPLNLRIDLNGKWRFRTGDSLSWAEPSYSHADWGAVTVPGQWENQGFKNYDGFAWYRRTFEIPRDLAREKLIFVGGRIDDRDAVYFNGTQIGSTGEFPQGKKKNHCQECYNVRRAYFLPPELVRPGRDNLIAVRVFDHGGYGGMWRGEVGVATRGEYLRYNQKR